ncbi:MAG: helix-turn-helix transcriptional regulator [Lachnospiraceae bacterium]
MNIKIFEQNTPREISIGIADRLKTIRKRRGETQASLSKKSGVSLGSMKRFETSGEISLASLIKISIALELEHEFDKLFTEVSFRNIQELIDAENK